MAIAFVNSTTGTSDGGATTLPATAANHTSGNLIVVGVVWSGNVNANVPIDTAGNTYVSTGIKANNGTSDHTEIFYAKNITGNASNVVTARFAASATFRRIMVLQYSGCDTTAPFDTGNQATGTSGTATTASFTTGTADEVICTFVGSSGAGNTWGAGGVGNARVTNLGTDSGCEDNIVSSTGSYTGSMTRDTGTPTWFVAAASFKIAGGGSTDQTVTAVVADATGDIATPTVSAGSNRVTPAADATGDTVAPTISAGVNIVAPALDATGDLATPTLSAGSNPTAPAADATGDIPNPAVSANYTATSPAADATGDIPAPAVTASANIVVGPLDATGDIPAPTITAGGNATVNAVPCTATGDIANPTPSAGANITGTPADGTGDIPAPTVTTTGDATVAAKPCTATGDLPTPTVSTGTSATVTAPPADSTGRIQAPTFTRSANVLSTPAAAAGVLKAPSASGQLPDTNPIHITIKDGNYRVALRDNTPPVLQDTSPLVLREQA